jgi:hypothetical protein
MHRSTAAVADVPHKAFRHDFAAAVADVPRKALVLTTRPGAAGCICCISETWVIVR